MRLLPGPWIRRTRLGPWLVVAYLFVLLHAFALARVLFPRAAWIARLERRWVDLWMR